MQIFVEGPLSETARNLMRKLGYGEVTKYSGQVSYVKRVFGGSFPRYHVYVEEKNGGMQINLHLDQKEASHVGTRAHAGEYDGPLVEKEMTYLVAWINHWKQEASTQTQEPPHVTPKKKKWFWE